MYMSYCAEEMGIPFPEVINLQLDNTTAEAFMNQTVMNTRLRHIDVRQDWVRVLRDHGIVKPTHVSSRLNMADMFTKIMGPQEFCYHRDKILTPLPSALIPGGG